jgi:bacillithiol system protein YtxJ
MNWNELTQVDQLRTIIEESKTQPVVIFKHSTSCSISKTSLNRLERNWKQEELGAYKAYYLDLLSHRAISTAIAQKFSVEHQSPQVLIIENGKSVYDQSHLAIDYTSIKQVLLKAVKN